ncbi:FAD-dependent thymidylate synthase [Geobacter pelophilus]|uniref:Flavin-dependent thymidylate synthase n=1 Tax=Geoanaerobacter pelophilus TaxID=60036 RepID=A0AAW4L2T0_9BACT|nr:FAD-dependent thymidylate synthase [Geoanaerobacter pelophilus]MBT0663837.1 FAD-dependent thymidylate synthase [Geoanaerobacter pelophilus]
MDITLLQHTPDPEVTVALAARLCYSKVGINDLREKLSRADVTSFLDKIMSLGHQSVLEHVSFTFGIEGISRACSHQLVRHRVASYSQQSQRYVEFKGADFPRVIPASIAESEHRQAVFSRTMEAAAEAYRALVDDGVPAEDARFVLPNAAETKIIVTMNARELLHFFELRCCERAQWEIRAMAIEMLRLIKPLAPTIFRDAGPGCVAGTCPEGSFTCGKAGSVRTFFKEMQ